MEAQSHPIRVLLVEADEDDFLSVIDFLSNMSTHRYQVDRVTDCGAACDALVRGDYDVCLLALRAGIESDGELANDMLSAGPGTPMILLADPGVHPIAIEAIGAGFADVLPKDQLCASLLERSIKYAMELAAAKRALHEAQYKPENRTREGKEGLVRTDNSAGDIDLFARSTLNALSANMAILDDEGFILCTNQSWNAFAQSNGAFETSFVGTNYLGVCDHAEGPWAEQAVQVAAAIREVIAGRRDGFELEYPCHSPGEERWFAMRVSRFGDCGPVLVIVAHEDITRRKRAEDALERQNARIQAVLDNLPAGVTLFEGVPFKPVLVNRMGEQLLWGNLPEGIDSNQLPSYFQTYRTGTDDPYPIQAMLVAQAMSGESFSADDLEVRRPDGSRIRLEVFGTPVRDASGAVSGAVAIFQDISERKSAEEKLRKSEERFRELAENIREVFWVRTPEEMLYISPAYERVWGRSCESLYRDPNSFMEFVHPEDKEDALKAHHADLEGITPLDQRYRISRSDGVFRWIWARSFHIRDPEQGALLRIVGIAEDITVRREAEEFLRIERDLALGLGLAANLTEALEVLLEACLKIDDLDSGAIYLVERETKALRMICHQGLSAALVEHVTFYEPTSPQARFAMRGEPGYWSEPVEITNMDSIIRKEGLRALASIPVKSAGEVVALLNVSSHSHAEITNSIRTCLESIASHIGEIISRVRLGETIKAQSDRLEEANAALRVLLRQREQDRSELEESLLANVKHLVLPYLDKLKSTRSTDAQRSLFEVLETNLREITSPFVRKISTPLLGLTPTEIRVAELIRQGMSSKEIANLLVTSESAIIFHRQGVRRKLSLIGKSINLQAYLATLA